MAINGTVVILPHHGVENRQAELREIAGGAQIVCVTRDKLGEVIDRAEVVAGGVPRVIFPQAKRLRWIHSWSAGQDNALFSELAQSDVIVTNASGNAAHPIAEQCLLLMMMLQRDTVRVLQQQRDHTWRQHIRPELYGKTVALIGLGDIGLEIARRARAFGTRVLGMRRSDRQCSDVDDLYPRERLHDMLSAADFVVMAAPLTAETRGMLGEAEFRAMKSTAYFVNVSRGGCVDEAALIRCMREGWIAGAGIDQPAQKPLPADSPLWDLPNTILTPAYGGHTPETSQRAIGIFLDNLDRYAKGQPLRNVVDKVAGY